MALHTRRSIMHTRQLSRPLDEEIKHVEPTVVSRVKHYDSADPMKVLCNVMYCNVMFIDPIQET